MRTQTTALDFMSVVEQHPDQKKIDAALRELEPRLFLDPELDPDFGMVVWTVKHHAGAGQEPFWICDWRDPETRKPLELSWALWSRIKLREQREPFKLRDEIKAQNARTRELNAERMYADYEEIARDVIPRINGVRSAAFPRSQALRRSRDRMRALGLNV